MCPTGGPSTRARVQSLWLLTLTRVRQSFCVINNSPVLEKQHDQNHSEQGSVRALRQPPQLQGAVTNLEPGTQLTMVLFSLHMSQVKRVSGSQQCLEGPGGIRTAMGRVSAEFLVPGLSIASALGPEPTESRGAHTCFGHRFWFPTQRKQESGDDSFPETVQSR